MDDLYLPAASALLTLLSALLTLKTANLFFALMAVAGFYLTFISALLLGVKGLIKALRENRRGRVG